MQLRAKCLCLTAVLLVILVSVDSARPYDEQPQEEQQQQEEEQNGNVRDKRTLNFLLKSFADAIGYDVQKRPSVLPFGVQQLALGSIIPPIGPVTPVQAPAVAPAAPAVVPAPAVMAPAAPAMVPAAPAMVPAAPAMIPAPAMAPAKPAMAPAAPAMVPAAPAMIPAAPAMVPAAPAMIPAPAIAPAKPAMAPAPAAMPPAAPAMPPAAPAAGTAAPAAPAIAPGMPPVAPAMAPAGAMPPAAPAAPAMPPAAPAAPAGRAAPLLTETIRKVFNLNFNWNRNLQPQINGVAPNASAAPAPQMPAGAPAPQIPATGAPVPQMPAGAPAPQVPAAGAPAPQIPAAAAPAPQVPAGAVPAVAAPAPAPQMPAAPAAGQAAFTPTVPNIVPLAVPAAKDPVPAPIAPAMVPAPAMPPAVAPAPAAPEMAPAPPAASTPSVAPAVPAPLYYQPNVQLQPNVYQDLQNIQQPQLYYPTEQSILNEPTSSENLQKDYSLPEAVQLFWQHSPWNQPHLAQVHNAVPEYREYSTPNGEQGYHVRRVQQNAHLQHHDLQPQDNDAAEEEEDNARERQEAERSSEENDDANGDSSKAFLTINHQPRGFQPAYAESRIQQGGFYQPGLPLAVHGVHEDKVLVAWPSPFELAGSEKKLKKVNPNGRILGAASENLEYRYEPENYGQFNFFTIPPPTKNQYENYEGPKDLNLEDTLSANAKINENNYGKKYTTVHIDRQTYHH